MLALTWGLHSYYGLTQVRDALAVAFGRTKVLDVAQDLSVTPRLTRRAGVGAVEVFFTLRTSAARAAAWCGST